MAKTLANLRTGVRLVLDEAAQTDFLDTEVLREINYAYQDLIGHVMEVYEDWYMTTTPKYITTVANQQQYTLDTGLIEIRRVEVNYKPTDSQSQPIVAIPLDMDELPLNLANQAIGGSGIFNAGYYVIGDGTTPTIGLVPVPTIAGTNAVSVWGIQMPADLVNDTDNVNIPYADRFAKVIEIKAAAELLRKGQQEEKVAAEMMLDYKERVQFLKQFLKDRKANGVNMIQDVEMWDTQFDNPLGA